MFRMVSYTTVDSFQSNWHFSVNAFIAKDNLNINAEFKNLITKEKRSGRPFPALSPSIILKHLARTIRLLCVACHSSYYSRLSLVFT